MRWLLFIKDELNEIVWQNKDKEVIIKKMDVSIMTKVIFYTSEICSLCEEAYALLTMFKQAYSFEIEERDIYTNDQWLEEYQLRIPVVEINGKQIDCEEISYDMLENVLKKEYLI